MTDCKPTEILEPFLRLNFATLWVREQERSRQFFVDQLGFQPIVDAEIPGRGRWIVVAPCPPHWLRGTAGGGGGFPGVALVAPIEGSEESLRIGRNSGLSFLTDNARAVFEEWSQRGVRFTLPPIDPDWGRGGARFAAFEDIDGNSFSIIEFDEATRTVEIEKHAQAARLETERRAAHDLAIAKEVQARLFPQRQPPLATLTYAGICYPARAVGGDYYDFLDLSNGRLGLVVADIAGKGMAAALLMANLQANLRSQCATASEQPHRFLQSVNELFYQNTADNDYATLCFAEYDDQSHVLRYANCGHLPALLLRGDGGLEKLESNSTVMGMFEHWNCIVERTLLNPGDTLLLYTDGVTEAFGLGEEEFGEERLVETLREHHDLTPKELLDAIVGRVRQFSPQDQADDMTLIVAKCS